MKKQNFITKFETENFLIGSFDSYIEESTKLLKAKENLTDEESVESIKKMPTTYRASILDKEGNFLGFIGLLSSVENERKVNLNFLVNKTLPECQIKELQKPFLKWAKESLNYQKIIENDTNKILLDNQKKSSANLLLNNKMLEKGISEETVNNFKNIPNLSFPYSIKINNTVIGVIGLTNLLWSNQRANLQLYLNPNLNEDEVTNSISGVIINEYLDLLHHNNIHSVNYEVGGNKSNLINLMNEKTNMNFYAEVPYANIDEEILNSKLLFQHTPNMKKEKDIIIPNDKRILLSSLETEKKEMDNVILSEDGFKLVKPSVVKDNQEVYNKALCSYVNAMQDRENFTKPLGDDKFVLQLGNQYYGLTKSFNNYDYLIFTEDNELIGFINVLRNNAKNKNADIEYAVVPKFQSMGFGKKIIEKFKSELYKVGYASISAQIFDFHKKSINLFEKSSEASGIRIESIYINGNLYDMHYMTAISDKVR